MRLGIVGGLAGLLTTPCPIGRAHHVASRRCPLAAQLAGVQKDDCATRLDMLAQLD